MKNKLLLVATLFLLSNCEALFVEDISEDSVVLLAPSDQSEVLKGRIQLNWKEVSDATEYQIQIAQPSFSAASQIVLDSIATTTLVVKELAIGEYEWRIRAFNSEFSTHYSTNRFTVQ